MVWRGTGVDLVSETRWGTRSCDDFQILALHEDHKYPWESIFFKARNCKKFKRS